MAVKREKIHFESVESLLGAPIEKDNATEIRIDQIYPFENHPFKVVDDDRMNELVESIKANGVLSPVLVRPDDEGTYEMISGHRRMHAAKLAGLVTIPAIIKEMTNDEAVICMVDANVQREEILPSERAFSLKMKMDAMRRQGARVDLGDDGTSTPKGWKSETASIVGEQCGLAKNQVRRYIRLTELIPELIDMVDDKKLTITLAVEISYFDNDIQSWLLEYIKDNGFIKPEQIKALKNQPNIDNMTQHIVIEVLNAALPGKKNSGKVNLSEKKLDKYFPPHYSAKQREEIILELLNEWKKRQEDA